MYLLLPYNFILLILFSIYLDFFNFYIIAYIIGKFVMITYFFNIFYNTFFSNADLIIPNLWLGSFRAALDTKFLIDNKINVIINCTENIPFIYEVDKNNYEDIEFIRIPVNDSLLEKDLLLMQDYFKIILPYLYKKYTNEKKTILIHCREGKQRSAIITAAFLKNLSDSHEINIIEQTSLNLSSQFNSIISYILTKRPQAFTYGFRINFKKTYKRYFNIN